MVAVDFFGAATAAHDISNAALTSRPPRKSGNARFVWDVAKAPPRGRGPAEGHSDGVIPFQQSIFDLWLWVRVRDHPPPRRALSCQPDRPTGVHFLRWAATARSPASRDTAFRGDGALRSEERSTKRIPAFRSGGALSPPARRRAPERHWSEISVIADGQAYPTQRGTRIGALRFCSGQPRLRNRTAEHVYNAALPPRPSIQPWMFVGFHRCRCLMSRRRIH